MTENRPVYNHGLEALPLNKSQLASLDFVVNRFFVKLFKTTDTQVVEVCGEQFDLVLPSMQIDRRRRNFVRFSSSFSLCDALLIAVYSATISW